MATNIKPLHDRVIIRRIEDSTDKTAGSVSSVSFIAEENVSVGLSDIELGLAVFERGFGGLGGFGRILVFVGVNVSCGLV